MKMKISWLNLIKVIVSLIGVILLGYWLIKPLWLTQVYGPELKQALQKYSQTLGTLEGQSDPLAMAQVATGKELGALIQGICEQCPGVLVATKTDVSIIQVVEYSPANSEVIARTEEGWHLVSPKTNATLGECHAQAFTQYFVLVREDGLWKVDDQKNVDANRVDDSLDLQTKYCGPN